MEGSAKRHFLLTMLTPPERIQNFFEMCYEKSKLNKILIGFIFILKIPIDLYRAKLFTVRNMHMYVNSTNISLVPSSFYF